MSTASSGNRSAATLLGTSLYQASKRWGDLLLTYASKEGLRNRTLGDVVDQGARAAAGLAELGLRQGDALVAQVPNWPEGGALLYASALLGLRIVPVIHIYGGAELSDIVRQTGAKAYVAPAQWRGIDFAERAEAIGRCDSIEHVVSIGGRADFASVEWDELVAGDARHQWPVTQSASDVCLVAFTSGTTSRPKGAKHTHSSLLSEVTLRPGIGERRDKSFLGAQPAGHMAGLLGFLRTTLTGASRAVFLDHWDASLALELITRYDLRVTTGPPFYLATLLGAAADAGLSRLEIDDWMSGGERVPPELVEEADAAGIAVYRCYGSTEHPTVSSSLPGDPLQNRAYTDGTLLPGVGVRILDELGREVGAGEEGELLTTGPDLFSGYIDAVQTAEALTADGFFRTGDVARLSPNGVLTITDRKKDIVIRGGENISSREVEEILLRHPMVTDAAVVAMPDRLYGERVCAFLITRSGASLSLEEVRAHFAEAGVAKQKTPERLEVVDEFPRTLVGKVRKSELRARASELAVEDVS